MMFIIIKKCHIASKNDIFWLHLRWTHCWKRPQKIFSTIWVLPYIDIFLMKSSCIFSRAFIAISDKIY